MNRGYQNDLKVSPRLEKYFSTNNVGNDDDDDDSYINEVLLWYYHGAL